MPTYTYILHCLQTRCIPNVNTELWVQDSCIMAEMQDDIIQSGGDYIAWESRSTIPTQKWFWSPNLGSSSAWNFGTFSAFVFLKYSH